MRAYLKKKVVLREGYTSGQRADFEGMEVHEVEGRWFLEFTHRMEKLPAKFAGVVDRFSLDTVVPVYQHREAGEYLERSARARVNLMRHDEGDYYKLEIEARRPGDIHDLLDSFQAGLIRPIVSYEGPQVGKSRAELKTEVGQLRQGVHDVIAEICDSPNPFCRRKTVVKKLERVLVQK